MTEIHHESVFNGKIVYGLSLDTNTSTLFWVVRDETGYHLHQSGVNSTSILPYSMREGSLQFIGGRLIWLSAEGDLILLDPSNFSHSIIKSQYLKVRRIAAKVHAPLEFSCKFHYSINPIK